MAFQMLEGYKKQAIKQNNVRWLLGVDLAEQVFLADWHSPCSVGGKERGGQEDPAGSWAFKLEKDL